MRTRSLRSSSMAGRAKQLDEFSFGFDFAAAGETHRGQFAKFDDGPPPKRERFVARQPIRRPPEHQLDACHRPVLCANDAHCAQLTTNIEKFLLCVCVPKSATHLLMNSRDPNSTDPTGADKPLLKQKHTESTSRTMRATGTPSASAALKTRAPSMCRRMPCCAHNADQSSRNRSGNTLPPHMLCVFSTTAI